MFKECSHQEAIRETVKILKDYGYVVKTEVWASTALGYNYGQIDFMNKDDIKRYYRDFKFNIANMFLGRNSPWISLHNSQFQTRLDIVGICYADLKEPSPYTFFVRKEPEEIALRTILIEVENKHSLEKAIERIRSFPAGAKVIIWTRGEIEGMLEDIPIIVAKNYKFSCYIPELYEICGKTY